MISFFRKFFWKKDVLSQKNFAGKKTLERGKIQQGQAQSRLRRQGGGGRPLGTDPGRGAPESAAKGRVEQHSSGVRPTGIRPVRPIAMQGIWDGMGALRARLGISPQRKARSSDMAASGPARPPSVPAAWWGHPFGGQRKSGRQFPCIGAACVAEELAPG